MHMANKEYEANGARLIDTKDDPNLGKRRNQNGEVLEPPCYVSYSKKHKHACLHRVQGCFRRPFWEIKNFVWIYGDESLQIDQYCKDCWKERNSSGASDEDESETSGPAMSKREEEPVGAAGSGMESGGNNSDSSTNPSLTITDVDELKSTRETVEAVKAAAEKDADGGRSASLLRRMMAQSPSRRPILRADRRRYREAQRRRKEALVASSSGSYYSTSSSRSRSYSTETPEDHRPDLADQRCRGRRGLQERGKKRRQGQGRSSVSRSRTLPAGVRGTGATSEDEEPQSMEVDES